MTSKIRIEYVRPRRSGDAYGISTDVIQQVVGQAQTFAVEGVSQQTDVAPLWPVDQGLHGGVFGRITVLRGAVLVHPAAVNPVATANAGVRIEEGQDPLLLPIEAGQRFAFIEAGDGAAGDMAAPRVYVDAVIPLNGSLSGAVDLSAGVLVGVYMPAAWTAADLSFLACSIPGGPYLNVFDEFGVERKVAAAASRYIPLAASDWIGVENLQIRSGISGAAVAQAAARTLKLVLQP